MNDAHDLFKVWGVNFGTFGVVTFTDVEVILKFTLLITSVIYTIMKIISWVREQRKNENDER